MKHLWQTTARTMLWGVLLSTGLSGCWSACDSSNLRAPDAFEPNDTPQTATPLETSRDGSFNTEENDTFKFTASAGETITITVQTLEAGAQPARYALCLSSVKQVFDDKFRCDNRAYPEGSTLSFSAPRDDTYYIDIVEPSPGCRHICGCPTRGSTYRVQLQRAPKVTSVLHSRITPEESAQGNEGRFFAHVTSSGSPFRFDRDVREILNAFDGQNHDYVGVSLAV